MIWEPAAYLLLIDVSIERVDVEALRNSEIEAWSKLSGRSYVTFEITEQ